jgi:hypothetical protein
MHIIYRITYLPHLKSETAPYYYVGSKYDYRGNYFGSPSSKQSDWYTGSLSISQWWKEKIKNNIGDFLFEIIHSFDHISPIELVEEEKKYQLTLDAKNSILYFNKSIATTGWVSVPRTEVSKKKISLITKSFWDSPAGLLKKERLSERNKKVKSQQMKEFWRNPSEAMLSREISGRPKGSKDLKPRKPKKVRKVEIFGVVYSSALEAANAFNVAPQTIRRKCKDESIEHYYYIN